MFYDNTQPPPSRFDMLDRIRSRMRLAELVWREWFEMMSQVAYHTHRACEFFVQNGAPLNERSGPFDFRVSRSPSEASNGAIDLEKLKQCLQSMDPMQAAQVIHAVQMMQAMEHMLKRQGSRANDPEGTAW